MILDPPVWALYKLTKGTVMRFSDQVSMALWREALNRGAYTIWPEPTGPVGGLVVYGTEDMLGDHVHAEKRKGRASYCMQKFAEWDVDGKSVIAAVFPKLHGGAHAIRHSPWNCGRPDVAPFENALIDAGEVLVVDLSH